MFVDYTYEQKDDNEFVTEEKITNETIEEYLDRNLL